jgi:NAD(P)-dependent dehydrogenase (short-subunit alcohol dehydrogenase family)
MREFGRADVLVNCAGVNSATPYLEITDEEWDKILAVNLRGVHLACQVFGRRMIEGGQGGSHGGSIINIGSVSADIPLSRVFAYSASKAGVVNLTRNLAREWGAQGVRVNAICPGFFPAEQNRKILDQKRTDDVIGHTPAGRFGRPEELVGPLLLLASRTAGSFITGAVLYVDGGFTAMTI